MFNFPNIMGVSDEEDRRLFDQFNMRVVGAASFSDEMLRIKLSDPNCALISSLAL